MKIKITRFMSGKLGYELEIDSRHTYSEKHSLEELQEVLIKLDNIVDSHNNKLTHSGDD